MNESAVCCLPVMILYPFESYSVKLLFLQGVSGPYWYAGAAVVQILCFGILAVYIKV